MEKIKFFLLWFLGIFFLLGGLGSIISGDFSGIFLILISIILIPIFLSKIEKKFNFKIKFLHRIIGMIILFIGFGIYTDNTEKDLSINNNEEKGNIINNKKEEINEKIVTKNIGKYKIVGKQDISHKVLNNKSLSSYSIDELEKLPMDKKFIFKVVLDENFKNNQLEDTIEKIINDIIIEDKDIDEITLFLYSDKQLSDGPYDIGSVIWAPKGELGNVDSNIAINNIRNNYKTTYKMNVKDIEKYFLQRNKKENKFNLTEEQRREYFKEIVKAEDRAKKEQPIDSGVIDEKIMMENIEKQNELMEKYRNEVMKKYNLTEDEHNKIISEAFKENWPLK